MEVKFITNISFIFISSNLSPGTYTGAKIFRRTKAWCLNFYIIFVDDIAASNFGGFSVPRQEEQSAANEISSINKYNRTYIPNCWKIALQFLKLSSIFGNFKIILLNDFMVLPSDALRCIASTILASSFVSGTQAFLGESPFPTTPPIADSWWD